MLFAKVFVAVFAFFKIIMSFAVMTAIFHIHSLKDRNKSFSGSAFFDFRRKLLFGNVSHAFIITALSIIFN